MGLKWKKIEKTLNYSIAKFIWGFDEKKEVPKPNYNIVRKPLNRHELEEFNAAFSSINKQLKEKYSSLNKFGDF